MSAKSIIQKIKQVFGLSGGGTTDGESPGESGTDVTVEREPDTDETGSGTSAGTATSQDSPAAAEPADEEPAAGADAAETEAEEPVVEKAEETETDTADEDPGSESVDTIKGIGPTYSDRLGDTGIETVDDLANAQPETVADAAKTGESKAMSWIDRAQEYRS